MAGAGSSTGELKAREPGSPERAQKSRSGQQRGGHTEGFSQPSGSGLLGRAEGLTLGVGGFGPGGCGGARASRGTGVSGQKEAVGRIGEQQRCREKEGGDTGKG